MDASNAARAQPAAGATGRASAARDATPAPLRESEFNELILGAGRAIDDAANLLRHGRAHLGALIAKGDRDYASRVDFQIEDSIRASLRLLRPGIAFLGEERGGSLDAELLWVLDPIDGTTNYVKGSPLCAISLALLAAGQPILAIVDVPLLDERYVARAGAGAYLNGVRLRIPDAPSLGQAVVAITDFAVADDRLVENPIHIALLARLAPRALGVRTHGSAALDLAWLAAGRLDGSMMLSNRPWDVSAGVLLARESGGEVYDRDGSCHGVESDFTIASGSGLKGELLGLLGAI